MTSAFNVAELWSLTATEAVHLLKTKSVSEQENPSRNAAPNAMSLLGCLP